MLNRFRLLQMIKSDLRGDGYFQHLIFPIAELNVFKTIQFSKRSTPECYGLACDLSLNDSRIKSFVEYYERQFFFQEGQAHGHLTTNGIAGHCNYRQAEQAAIYEILERDAILVHWYLKANFLNIDETPPHISSMIKALEYNRYKTIFRKTHLGYTETVICFIVDMNSGGFVIGSCAGNTLTYSQSKAFTEAIINLFFGNNGLSKEELIQEFKENGVSTLRQHRTFWLHLSVIPEWILETEKKERFESQRTPSSLFDPFYKKIGPIYVVGGHLPNILTLKIGFPGHTEVQHLQNRFSADIGINTDDLSLHPIP